MTKDNELKKSSIDTIEIGNLLFGHSRGEYLIPRGNKWEDCFHEFLKETGFDSYGYTETALDKYLKAEIGYGKYSKDTNVKVESVLRSGRWVGEEDRTDVRINGISYRGNVFEYRNKLYSIYPSHNQKYCEDEGAYFDALDKWENSLSKEDYKKYLNNKLMVPLEIRELEPKEDASVVEPHIKEIYFEEETHSYFENDVFIVSPYFWGESEELHGKPNFVFKPEGIEIHWYKYPLRDSYINKKITLEHFKEILEKCKDSVK